MSYRALAQLRLDSMLGPFYPGTPAALGFHERMIQRSAEGGQLHQLDERAFVAVLPEQTDPLRYDVFVHRLAGDPEALAWCRASLSEVLGGLGDDVEVLFPIRELELRQFLVGQGFGCNGVHFAGRVDVALERLIVRYAPPTELPGLRIRPIQPEDADAIVALRERGFGAEPIYFWYGAHPATQARVHQEIRAGTFVGPRFVIETELGVRGLFEARDNGACPHHGTSAGVGLMFDTELRGRGLAKVAYRVLLEDLREREIAWFKGVTGRKPVIHLSQQMGRGVTGLSMRRNWVFPDGWFSSVVDSPTCTR